MKKILSVILASLFIISAAVSCADKKAAESESAEAVSSTSAEEMPTPLYQITPADENVTADTSRLHSFYAKLTDAVLAHGNGENAVISPVNIYTAIAMLTDAADGDSRNELLALLGLDSADEAAALSTYITESLTLDEEKSKTLFGASLWMNESFEHSEECAKLISRKHLAELFSGDFSSDTYQSAIKSWLNGKTKGLLSDHVDNLQISPESSGMIITTLYFKDIWKNAFNEKLTEENIFHAPSGDIKHDFMKQPAAASYYYKGEGFTAVNLHYEKAGSLMLLLPDDGITPESLFVSADAQSLMLRGRGDTTASVHDAQVTLSLPKFDINESLELRDIISMLGAPSIFSEKLADFSSLFPNKDVLISSIVHCARLRIDEEGGEGAAFTGITMAPTSLPPSEEKMEIVFDRPFAFSLLSPNGEPLFTGIVNDPTKN